MTDPEKLVTPDASQQAFLNRLRTHIARLKDDQFAAIPADILRYLLSLETLVAARVEAAEMAMRELLRGKAISALNDCTHYAMPQSSFTPGYLFSVEAKQKVEHSFDDTLPLTNSGALDELLEAAIEACAVLVNDAEHLDSCSESCCSDGCPVNDPVAAIRTITPASVKAAWLAGKARANGE